MPTHQEPSDYFRLQQESQDFCPLLNTDPELLGVQLPGGMRWQAPVGIGYIRGRFPIRLPLSWNRLASPDRSRYIRY